VCVCLRVCVCARRRTLLYLVMSRLRARSRMTATMKAKNTTMSTELTMENQWTWAPVRSQRPEWECEGNTRARAVGGERWPGV